VPSGATGLDWSGSPGITGTGTSKITTASTAGNYSAQVRSYLTSGGTTCYSGFSGSTSGSILNPAAVGQPADPVCGCASSLVACGTTCQAACSVTVVPDCAGIDVVTSSTVTSPYAAKACSDQGTGWRIPTKEEAVCACESGAWDTWDRYPSVALHTTTTVNVGQASGVAVSSCKYQIWSTCGTCGTPYTLAYVCVHDAP
jgi:hypothetical protein